MVVIHENRGLNPHIEDIARRLALDNFVAFAPDALTPLGGYPVGEDEGARAVPEARSGQDARGHGRGGRIPQGAGPSAPGEIGVVGFCWGGGMSNFLATRLPDLGGRGAVLRQRGPGRGACRRSRRRC